MLPMLLVIPLNFPCVYMSGIYGNIGNMVTNHISTGNRGKIPCDWCGKESVVFWRDETLCDNCWKYIKIDEENNKLKKFGKPNNFHI